MVEANNYNIIENNEINLLDLFLVLWKKKTFIIISTLASAALSIYIALSLPNIYTSHSLLAPTSKDESLSSKLKGFSSIASIGGFSLPSNSVTKSQEAIERIKSYEFFSTYFLPNIKLENLMATKEWLPKENIIIYKSRIYDEASKKWVRKASYPKTKIPSSQEAYEVYKKIMSVSENKKTSLITISVDHYSPHIAKKWVEIIIFQINESMRKFDADIAQKSISFLNEEASSTKNQSLKDVIYSLLENQMQIKTITYANEYYVLKVINSPIAPEKKSKPSRDVIALVLTFMGSLISVIWVLIQYFRNAKTKA